MDELTYFREKIDACRKQFTAATLQKISEFRRSAIGGDTLRVKREEQKVVETIGEFREGLREIRDDLTRRKDKMSEEKYEQIAAYLALADGVVHKLAALLSRVILLCDLPTFEKYYNEISATVAGQTSTALV
jgi:hypothetical protein